MWIRPARDDDHPHFLRLFPELRVDDPVPDLARWCREIGPQSWIAEDGGVLGYCYVQLLDGAAYVRHLVTGPEARRRGVGRALLDHVAAAARTAGATEWHLNVKPENTAARALYEAVGMREAYASTALRLSWAGFEALGPAEGEGRLVTDDVAAEAAFGLPRGQLRNARVAGRSVFGVVAPALVGLAVYDPGFPGAFPFRARSLGVARTLAATIRAHAHTPDLQFVVEDDAVLTEAAVRVGAVVRLQALHYQGPL